MAGFNFGSSSNVKALEEKIKQFEVTDIPLNISSGIIREDSSAIISKHRVRGKTAAVKKFKGQLSKKSILKTANALRVLKHTNVASFLGYSCRPSAICFEYCEVEFCDSKHKQVIVHSLQELINFFNDHEYFNLIERKGYCIQACQGISYLHSLKIIHKDIKPSNLLVSGKKEDIVVKITDFNEIAAFKDTCLTTTTTRTNLKGKNFNS